VPLRFNTCLPSAARLGIRAWDNENGEAFISLEELGPLKNGERDILHIADRPRNPEVI